MTRMPKHGTRARYEAGCSCGRCRRSNRDQMRLSRSIARRRFAAGEVEIKHGTQVGYDYWGCKCAECKEANRERHLAKRQKARGEVAA